MTEKRKIPEIMLKTYKKVEKKLLKAQNSTKRHCNRQNGGMRKMGGLTRRSEGDSRTKATGREVTARTETPGKDGGDRQERW